MPTQRQLREHLNRLTTILFRYGASFPVPVLERYEFGVLRFSFTAELPGPNTPLPATIRLAEIWQPTSKTDYRRAEYAFDFIDHPGSRRRAFHCHDPEYFAREFGVLVHEHCEERLASPDCDHYYGLPIDAYDAIGVFARSWGRPGALGCAEVRCLEWASS